MGEEGEIFRGKKKGQKGTRTSVHFLVELMVELGRNEEKFSTFHRPHELRIQETNRVSCDVSFNALCSSRRWVVLFANECVVKLNDFWSDEDILLSPDWS